MDDLSTRVDLHNRTASERQVLVNLMLRSHANRDRLWRLFLAGRPSDDELMDVIVRVEPLRTRAWRLLEMHKPSRDKLLRLVNRVPDLRDRAGRELVKVTRSIHDLCVVMNHCSESVAEKAWRAFADGKRDRQAIRLVAIDAPRFRERAALLLLERYPTVEEAQFVLTFVESLVDEALGVLLQAEDRRSFRAAQHAK